MNKKSMILFFTALLSLFFFTSCFSIRQKNLDLNFDRTSFWFSLNPIELTLSSNNKIIATQTGVKGFDELMLKTTILLAALPNQTQYPQYKPRQFKYEVKMTIAMIDSIDPLFLFKGKQTISLVQEAYDLLLEKRNQLLAYL